MAEGFWIVATTKSRRERWAAENVSRQGFKYYLPFTAQLEQGKLRPVCVFPGYLFVLTNGRWRSLLSTFGVSSLIMQGQQPAVVPVREIERLRAREDKDGLISLPKFTLKSGDAVRITGGPLMEKRGIYDCDSSKRRVQILLDFMGRRTSVLVGEEFVEALA
jgi:transcriptional antiterminator RfaH